MPKSRRLLVSIHDVSPRFEAEVDRLADLVQHHTGPARFAMLVVPNHWGSAPLAAAPVFGARLRGWAEQGVEMFVHGWFHRDDGAPRGALAGFKGRHMTAEEGEFLALDRQTALKRMRDGRALIEDVTGKSVAGFVAPAWLYGTGATQALAEAGFPLVEDHFRIWSPLTGRSLARGPAITWASRSPGRIASSLIFARIARAALVPLRTVRVAVHPGDTSSPLLLADIERTLARFARVHPPGRYADLLTEE